MPVLTANIQKQIKETDAYITQLETTTGQLQAYKEQLAIKVHNKKQELKRAHKRLQSLSDVRYSFIIEKIYEMRLRKSTDLPGWTNLKVWKSN